MSENLAMMSATELVAQYRKKALSPVDVTRAVLDRIQKFNETLNAFCFIDEEFALASAKASEDRWQKSRPIGLVDGVPTTIKDTYLVKGWPTRRGSLTSPPDGPWEEDAAATARLREHGAVFLGKTTTPEFAWKAVTDSPLTGITRNPWNVQRTPGGSSGGACVAAATGMGALHLGGDGAGSIRIPAAFCGVYGFKANYGRVPVYPQLAPGTLTHLGPITRTVTDAALMLEVIAEPDTRDWLALPYQHKDYRIDLEKGIRNLRIGFSKDFGYVEVDPEIADLVETAAKVFENLGAVVEETDPGFDNPRHAFDVYYYSLFSFMLETMSDEERDLLDPGLVEIADEGNKFNVHDLMNAEMTRASIAHQMDRFHQTYDLLISPQVPLAAFEVGVECPKNSGMTRWLDWTPFTYPFNFTGQPAASVPCGFNKEGLPIAIQIVGPRFSEPLVFRASRAYESLHTFKLPILAS
jgi:aspartyl-tRNA(Asn)/glutamyl-tRNA(Gln) amidotransferase subunit A